MCEARPEALRKNETPTVSVIIPVYNNAKFVEDALDCLERQGLDSFEAIAINDGSTDGSGGVLDNYAATHSWLTVIHQPNSGVSAARNAALDRARGTYVAFLDSDDTFLDGSLSDMVLVAEQRGADLVIGESRSVGEFGTSPLVRARKLSQKGRISREDLDLVYNFSCCNKLFRRALIEEHALRYPALRHAEDGVFLYSYLCHCGLITGCPRYVYRYVKHLSIVAKSTLKRLDSSLFDDVMKACDAIRALTSDWSADFKRELGARILRITIMNEYYRRLWTYDDDMLETIISRAEAYVRELGDDTWQEILALSEDLEASEGFKRRADILTSPLVSVVVEPGLVEQDYRDLLNSLYYQTCPNFEVVAHSSYESLTPSEYRVENLSFASELGTISNVLAATKGRTIQVVQEGCVYNDNSLVLMTRRLRENDCSFVTVMPKRYDGIDCKDYKPANQAFTKAALRDYQKDEAKKARFEELDVLSCNKLFARAALEQLVETGVSSVGDLVAGAYAQLSYKRFSNVKIATVDRTVEPAPAAVPEPAPQQKKPLSKREKAKRLAYGTFSRVLPVNRRKVLFLSDIRSELGGNYAPLKDMCEQAGYHVVCDFRAAKNDWLGKKRELKQCFDIATAGTIFLEDFHKDTAYMHVRRGQRLCQLWHAAGAFKKFAWSRVGGNENINIHPGYRKYTHAITSSEDIRANYAEAFDITLDKVCATGIPRTDIFFDEEYARQARERLRKRYPVLQGKKVLLIAPTYRGTTLDKATYPFDKVDPVALHEALGDEWVIVFKWHPAMATSKGKKCPYDWKAMESYALDLTGERDINDLLILSDVLVTDYSSIIFEYALLDKPIIYHWFDVNSYIIGRGMYYEMDAYVYGMLTYDADELTEAVLRPVVDEERRKAFVERFMSACDGNATRKVFDWVMGR